MGFSSGFCKTASWHDKLTDSQRAGLVAAALNSESAGTYAATKDPKNWKKRFASTAGGSYLGGPVGATAGFVGGTLGGLGVGELAHRRGINMSKSFVLPNWTRRFTRLPKGSKMPYVMAVPALSGALIGNMFGKYLGAKKGYESV